MAGKYTDLKSVEAIDKRHLALDVSLEEELEKASKKTYKNLLAQIETEYNLAWFFMKPKFDEWALRLKLYNNQKRDKNAVGDPLLFTTHQTVLAALYDDKLAVSFEGRERGDEETADNLNALAEYDYSEMGKDMFDYDFDFDASFFGRSLAYFMDFDRKTKTPIPENIDIMTWLRDPRAKSVNGDRRGRGAMRFGGREIRLTKREMEKAGVYFNLDLLKKDSDSNDVQSLLDENARLRAAAAGYSDISKFENLKGDNAQYRILEWLTFDKGKMVMVGCANNKKLMVRYTPIDNKGLWPIIDRAMYPISQSWDGVSIPDLVEDKQRKRSALENMGLESVEIGLKPKYLYNTNKIKNKADLNDEAQKYIAVDGDPTGAIVPQQRDLVKQEVSWIMDVLDNAAQKATATPELQQGSISDEKRTATELTLVDKKVGARYSLSAKVFGWSEKRFWDQWYFLYKKHFDKDIDEKMIRIAGVLSPKWRGFTRENIIGNSDPDIIIESRVLSEAKRYNKLQEYRGFLQVLLQDPTSNRRLAIKHYGKLIGVKRDELNVFMPPTIDEILAEEENEILNKGKLAQVRVEDDDIIHMEIHNKAVDNPQKYAHIQAHKKAMLIKKMNPNLAPAPASPIMLEGNQKSSAAGGNNAPNAETTIPTNG